MKVKIKKQKKNFQPIKMEVVFESQEEINDLYNRVNINNDIIRTEITRGFKENGEKNSWEIYEQLTKLI
tara:strand:+ start:442 stop:648 length:207 start_codon:yes stop_codon:yes gene_type:complete